MSKLNLAQQAVATQLSRFAAGSGYWDLMAEVFGMVRGQAAAHAIQAQLMQGALAQLGRGWR
ncbi:MAG: hypothetical protein ACKO8I_19895 [Cyanobacteriota bacterium]